MPRKWKERGVTHPCIEKLFILVAVMTSVVVGLVKAVAATTVMACPGLVAIRTGPAHNYSGRW